jgi:hypothetical protein
MVYWDTVRSSSETTRNEAPCEVTGNGWREVTEAVDTGNGEEVNDTFDVESSRCKVTMEEVATRTCSVSAVEEERRAIEVGEGVLAGRAKVLETLVTSGENTSILVAVEAMIPLSSDHRAVIGDGRVTFLTT